MQTPQVEHVPVKMKTDVYAITVVEVLCGLLEHHAKQNDEQYGGKNTALFHTICNREGLQKIVTMSDLSKLAFMELYDHGEELWWAA